MHLEYLNLEQIREFYGCLGSLSHHFLMEIELPVSKLARIQDSISCSPWMQLRAWKTSIGARCLREQLILAEFPCYNHALRFFIKWLWWFSSWGKLEWNLEKVIKHTFSEAKCSFKSFDWEEAGCGGAPTKQLLHSQLWSGVYGKKIWSLNLGDREDL